jgi:hypothetical protein
MTKDNSRIIPFPKSKTTRVLSYQKSESRQILGALSLVSLVLMAVFANDQMTKSQRPIYVVSDNMGSGSLRELNRAIASSRPMNPLRDLEWEHQLAKKLGKGNVEDVQDVDRTPASFGRQASHLDQIRFGVLAGKYRLSADASEKLKDIDYVESLDAGESPQYLNRQNFLRDYREEMALQYSTFEFAGMKGTTELYRLKDSQNQVVGQAQFVLDDQGRFLSFKLSQNQ